MKIATTPPEKSHPPFLATSLLNLRSCQDPLYENLFGGSTPSPQQKRVRGGGWWGAHCVSRAKGHKMVQNDKTLYPLCSISQNPYIIWLSFMIYMCKMIISPCVFSIFFNIFIFRVVSGVKGQKMTKNWQKWQKNYVHRASYLRMVVIYGTHV